MHVSIRPAVFMAEFYARLHMAKKEEEEERSLLQSWLFLLAGDEPLLFYEPSRKGGQRFLTRDRPLYRYFHLTL